MPFILHYPAKLPAGEIEDRPVMSFDLYPTFLSQAHAQPAEGTILDGKDLMPYLLDQPDDPIHDVLVWDDRMGGEQVAVRKGDWKLFIDNSERWGINAEELYNLAEDIDESDNVLDAHPDVVAELKGIYIRWLEAMPPDVGDYVQIDNSDSEHLTLAGSWEASSEAQWERGGDYLTGGNSGKGEKTARFTLPLDEPGYYELEAIWPKQWPEGTVRAENVPVTINHYFGTTTAYIDQNDTYIDNKVISEYVDLGKFYFGEEGGSVTFSNEGTEGLVLVDAIRFLNWSIQDKVSPRRWRQIYWGRQAPGPEIMSEDTDGDGLINMMEFAFGLNPLVADGGAMRELGLKLSLDTETDQAELSFEGSGDRRGMVYRLEHSPDLKEWPPLAQWIAGEDITHSPEMITFLDSASKERGTFYRLVLEETQ